MQVFREKPIKDLLVIHIIFAVIAAITLIFPFPQALISGKLLVLIIIYNGLIIIEFYSKGYEDWRSIWTFSIVLSLLMVFPDWYLSETLSALQFFDDGFPMIGSAIPIYMAGLWAIPFFIIIFIAKEIQKRKSQKMAYTVVAIASLVIFSLAELTLVYLPSWTATVIGKTGNLAWYIIIPELLLGLSTFICYDFVKDKHIWMKIIGAFTVMVFYIGNASFFYFIIESLLLGA
ncbi:MAG: hypothetical protein OEV85_01730 [Candidatus Thorarchaeota archaeon]|nr:hypothetical protein [Candidatus Thorarchaeota archaeon]